jgi:hypothetical protein|tara:strand:+ start:7150 stop:7464 length:315 start_codon:yes stop_codon:yes gene_type:complete
MKTFIMVIFSIAALPSTQVEAQKTESIMATYMGSEEGIYYFSQGEETIAFQEVDENVSEYYNLNDDSLKNQAFKVTYTFTEDMDKKSDEESTILTIVGLESAEN